MRVPLREVADSRRHAFRMEGQPQRVDRRFQQVRRRAFGQQHDSGVGVDEIPLGVHDDCRVRLMPVEQRAQRVHHGGQRRCAEIVLRVSGRVATCEQQRVAFPQWHVEVLGQSHDHLAGGLGAAGLDEAQMTGRDLGLQR
jgi:hypothetical protein